MLWRCDNTTSNVAEQTNAWLRPHRNQTITQLNDAIWNWQAKQYQLRAYEAEQIPARVVQKQKLGLRRRSCRPSAIWPFLPWRMRRLCELGWILWTALIPTITSELSVSSWRLIKLPVLAWTLSITASLVDIYKPSAQLSVNSLDTLSIPVITLHHTE